MISEMPKPVTDEELTYIKHVAPDIVDAGLLRLLLDPLDGPAMYPLTDLHVRRGVSPARWFIRRVCNRTRSINYTLPSQVLCEDATHWLTTKKFPYGGVVPDILHGAFIAGAILEGYPIEVSGTNVYFPLVFTPEYERLRQLRLSVEVKARDALAWKKSLRETSSM